MKKKLIAIDDTCHQNMLNVLASAKELAKDGKAEEAEKIADGIMAMALSLLGYIDITTAVIDIKAIAEAVRND